MRRIARAAGAGAAAALLLGLVAPGTATAGSARGVLLIDGSVRTDPSGCHPLGDYAPSEVTNLTDETAFVWSGPFCDGRVTAAVLPGQTLRPAPGMSLYLS